MDEPPFGANLELCHTLTIAGDELSIRRRPRDGNEVTKEKNYLPGQPRIALQDPSIESYLEQNFLTRDLDTFAPHLWLVGRQDSSHISSLTLQNFRGRDIIITEDPGLHLIWIYDRVYIKPIPRYLLSHAFWKFFLLGEHSPISEPGRKYIGKAALGFLRSYSYLIRHKSDFFIATDDKLRLLPKNVSYSDFIKFITAFERVLDEDVSPRYSFGELRLSRLNIWSKIFLQRFTYRKVHQQYGAYFARFYGPLLFVFAIFSLSLSAMQLELAIQRPNTFGTLWQTFARISGGLAALTLICVALIALILLLLFVSLFLRELNFAVRAQHRKRVAKIQPDTEQLIFAK